MASYKILVNNSTLGDLGTVVTEADVVGAPADVELLVASGIIEPVNPKKKED